jgi:O-antigen ligase
MRTNLSDHISELRERTPAFLGLVVVVCVAGLTGLTFVNSGFWVALGVLVAAGATVVLFLSAETLVLTIFLAKPFIDMLWFAGWSAGGMSVNAQSVLSTVVIVASVMFLIVHRPQLRTRLALPMFFVVLTNLWALATTPGKPGAVEFFIRIVCGFPLVFVVMATADRLPSPRTLLKCFFAVMTVVCITVMLQPLGVLPYTSFDDPGIGRATGFYFHPWDVARYMVVFVPLLLAAMDDHRREKFSLGAAVYWLILALALATTFVTYLKAAWIAVFFQILLWLFLTKRRASALFLLLVAIVLIAFPLRQGFTSVFSDLWKLKESATRGQALSGRVFVWSEYWKGLRSTGLRGIFLGQGFSPPGLGATNRAAHDDYLRILVMNGVVGLMAYVALIVAALRSLSKAVRQLAAKGGLEWRIGVAVQCLLAAYLLMGITADPSSYPSLTLYIWLLVGLVMGYAKLQSEPLAEDAPSGSSG